MPVSGFCTDDTMRYPILNRFAITYAAEIGKGVKKGRNLKKIQIRSILEKHVWIQMGKNGCFFEKWRLLMNSIKQIREKLVGAFRIIIGVLANDIGILSQVLGAMLGVLASVLVVCAIVGICIYVKELPM